MPNWLPNWLKTCLVFLWADYESRRTGISVHLRKKKLVFILGWRDVDVSNAAENKRATSRIDSWQSRSPNIFQEFEHSIPINHLLSCYVTCHMLHDQLIFRRSFATLCGTNKLLNNFVNACRGLLKGYHTLLRARPYTWNIYQVLLPSTDNAKKLHRAASIHRPGCKYWTCENKKMVSKTISKLQK